MNDLKNQTFLLQSIVNDLTSLFELARSRGASRILSVGVPTSAFLEHSTEAMTRRNDVNESLKKLAARSGGYIRYVDCPVEYGVDPYETDGLHFAPKAYEKLALKLYEVVRKMMDQ